LDEVLSQFGLGLVPSKAARLQMLNERLQLNEQRGVSSVLVVDEAQAIESFNGFEELRLLTNYQLNDRYLLTVVLIGQPELRGLVADIPQLSQRIAVRAHLGPFTAEETTAYIGARMGAVTDRTDVFTKEAIASIFEQSGGIGRVINALCDQCLSHRSMTGSFSGSGRSRVRPYPRLEVSRRWPNRSIPITAGEYTANN
jgi:general secretion pathway protein A